MIIYKATYGGKDVKSILEEQIKDGSLKIKVGNDLFGDPSFGIFKYLEIESSLGSRRVPEDSFLSLPDNKSTILPGISCYCSTYGRPTRLLENSIQCFLEQDYQGPKELVILNDFDRQELIFDHPEVRIINHPTRITPLGKKFNYNISLCKYDILATWEDDDVFLKNRLSYSYENLNNGIFHTHSAFFEVAEKNIVTSQNVFHSTHMFTREVFETARYTEVEDSCSLDISLMSKLKQKLGNYTQTTNINDIFYIYVWGGSQSYHGSGHGPTNKNISETAKNIVEDQISKNNVATGKIYLNPKLRYDFYSCLPR